jgi:poly(hydroxyalkanoate) granule-associated protein
MVKKLHAATSPAAKAEPRKSGKSRKSAAAASGSMPDSVLAKSVKDSAHHIWLAGMGAFSKAQEEGTKVFEALVKEGQSLQRKTQSVAEEKIGEVTGKMTAMAGTVQARANQNWDKLEGIFEARTAKAMNKLGVPTAKDVEALIERVDELAAAVAKLSRQMGSKAPAQARAKRAAATEATESTEAAVAAKPVARRRRAAAAPAPVAVKVAAKRLRKAAPASTPTSAAAEA